MTKTAKANTPRAPRLDAAGIAAHLSAAWSFYSYTADGEPTCDLEGHQQASNLLETLERLLLQIPARDAVGAIAQLAVLRQELDTLSAPGPNWVPPDWSTVADVVGVATVVLAKALGVSDTPVLREYCGTYYTQASVHPVTICRVAKAVGV